MTYRRRVHVLQMCAIMSIALIVFAAIGVTMKVLAPLGGILASIATFAELKYRQLRHNRMFIYYFMLSISFLSCIMIRMYINYGSRDVLMYGWIFLTFIGFFHSSLHILTRLRIL